MVFGGIMVMYFIFDLQIDVGIDVIVDVWYIVVVVFDLEVFVFMIEDLGVLCVVEVDGVEVCVDIILIYSGCFVVDVICDDVVFVLMVVGFVLVFVWFVLFFVWIIDWMLDEGKWKF